MILFFLLLLFLILGIRSWIEPTVEERLSYQSRVLVTAAINQTVAEELERLGATIREFKIPVKETNPFEQAQICTGGVDTAEIEAETMQSKRVPGLYIVGELLDVDGICGGYNLQWAWTSGYLAGKGAANA